MNGLYALKPWYAARLGGVRRVLVAHRVSPNALTVTGIGFGLGAGLTLVLVRPGPLAAVVVGALLAARLACANLDGGVARDLAEGHGTTVHNGPAGRFGAVVNELGDRLAELGVLAGLIVLAPPALVVAAALAASAPSWVSLAGATAGADRLQGGPVGKTERCLVLVLIAATGWAIPLIVVLIVGSLFTAWLRLARLRQRLLTP